VADNEPLPRAFDPDQERDKFLIRFKKRAVKNFKLTKASSLENATHLAYWLFVFARDDEAMEVCRFVGRYQFQGNFNLWSWVETALALESRLARQAGEDQESAGCVQRMRAAGVVQRRLEGNLLDGPGGHLDCIRGATAAGDKSSILGWSLRALMELCFLIELGGSASWPVDRLEKEFQEVLSSLRVLVDAPSSEPGSR
jgi:hypothetical protein